MTNNITNALIDKINKELIEPTYYDDIKNNLYGRSKWKTISDITETISKILAGITTVLAFAAGFFDMSFLSFMAGCLGTISLVLLQFSSYCSNESKERTIRANQILKNLGITNIIDINDVDNNDKIIEKSLKNIV